jgi:hypothetical protein
MDHFGPGHLHEELDHKVRCTAGAGGAEVKRLRLRAQQLDEFLQVRRFHRGVCDEYARSGGKHRNGCDAPDGVVRQLVERSAGGIGRRHHGERVTVRSGARRDIGADRAAGARAIIDDELLAELLEQTRRQQARDDIGAVAGRERYDHAHRPLGPFSALSMGSRQGSNESQDQQSAASSHRCRYHLVRWFTANGSFHVMILPRRQESYNAAPEVQVLRFRRKFPSGELP